MATTCCLLRAAPSPLTPSRSNVTSKSVVSHSTTTTLRIRGCRHRRSLQLRASSSSSDDDDLSLEERKKLLIRLCAGTDRGKSVTPETARAIETQVRALEACNAIKDPAVAPGITGKWSLLYTGATPEDAARRAELEGAVGSTLTEVTGSSGNAALATYFQSGDAEAAAEAAAREAKPLGRSISLLSGVVENKGNFQDIDADSGTVENRAELEVFGKPLEVRIEASCVPVDAALTGGDCKRLAVAFRRVRLTFGSLPSLVIPLGWINEGKGPEGWLDTTYLDEDLRLGRGDKGSTFVTVRRTAA